MLERPDPWDIKHRFRGSMQPFRGAPWKTPITRTDKLAAEKRPAPGYFSRYKRMLGGALPEGQSANIAREPKSAAFNHFERSDVNPAVALDKESQKFRLLITINDQPKPKGRFHVVQEGIEGIAAHHDMISRGPFGIEGVPISVCNPGPPGVALLPQGHWQKNVGSMKERPTISWFKTQYRLIDGVPDHNCQWPRPGITFE